MASVRARAIAVALAAGLVSASAASAQTKFVGLGDSIGEGVQTADANEQTQFFSFLNLIAWRMGAPFPLPYIRTSLFATVGDTDNRSRVDPSVQSLNLAVSGADVHSLLFDRANALTTADIDSETDLVLFPRQGSQMEIAERLAPEYAAVWIGNNDALGAALAFDRYDASQLTPIDQFTSDFTQIVDRLQAAGTKAIFGTIPDLTAIGYLLTPQDLVRFTGSSYGLPNGSLVGLPTMVLLKLGLADASWISNPNYVLDPAEQHAISTHIAALNGVIRSVAASRGMAVVDIHAIYNFLASQTTDIAGVPLTTRFMGGLFSLDGVHPSNMGQALSAFFFIDEMNRHYGANIPQIDGGSLFWFLLNDPHIDKDGDGRVAGRFGAGLLETFMAILEFSGDSNDTWTPPAEASAAASASGTDAALARTETTKKDARASRRTAALDEYQRRTGRDLRTMSREERAEAMRELFGN